MSGFPRLPDPPVSYSQRDQAEFRRALTGYLSGVEGFASTTPAGTSYTKAEADALLAAKAAIATTLAGYGITDAYTKTAADALLAAKANVGDSYTKAEDDALLAAKADSAASLAGYGITDAYTKTEADVITDALDARIDAFEPSVSIRANRITTNQAFSTNTFTAVLWNGEITDTDGGFDPATGVYTASIAGKYLVSSSFVIVDTAPGNALAIITQNGSATPLEGAMMPFGPYIIGSVSGVLTVAPGDTIGISVLTDAAVSSPEVATGGIFNIERLRD